MLRDANAGEDVHGVMERKAAPQGTVESTDPRPDMLFSDYLLFWLDWKRTTWEAITYEAYDRAVKNRIAPYFAERKIRLNTITAIDIQRFYSYCINVRGNKGSTAIHFHANIRKALADAVKIKLLPYNPAVDVERPKLDNFVSTYYNAEELMEMLPLFAGTKMELPVMLTAYYGLRRSETIGLKWSAIDFQNRTITISHTLEVVTLNGKVEIIEKDRTKNKSSFRSLPLIPVIEDLLLQAKKQQKENQKLCGRSYNRKFLEYVCVDEQGNIVSPDYVSAQFHRVLKQNGKKMIRFHDLRHSCASLLLANGVSLKEIQVWLGHSNYSTTANIYAHLDVSSKQNAADTIAGCLMTQPADERDWPVVQKNAQQQAKKKNPKRKSA
ncbi:MAG: site-specific integrase [Pygmaiobacter sp.]|nr:site-specific integrase [Pygmaiobacter sp.]